MPQVNQNSNQNWHNFVMSRSLQLLCCFRKIRHPKLTISGDAMFAITQKIVATKATGRFGTDLNKSQRSFVTDPSPISKMVAEPTAGSKKRFPVSELLVAHD
jgi:hypothetical protein